MTQKEHSEKGKEKAPFLLFIVPILVCAVEASTKAPFLNHRSQWLINFLTSLFSSTS